MTVSAKNTPQTEWLVLIHQYPKEPGSLRVKIWRRLQRIGAVAIKNSMYVLPLNEQCREDFQWVLREIIAAGAEAAILESRFVDGMTDQQVRALFNDARDADYAALANEIREHLQALPTPPTEDPEMHTNLRAQLARARKRLAEIEANDFFGADGREAAAGLISEFADRMEADSDAGAEATESMGLEPLKGKVWVTRSNVGVDRIASAWLLRRWIDPGAVFKFTSDRNYQPDRKEVRFDMYEAEFTHEGDRCTFEVLLARAGIDDPALGRIAEIVHDIDLKDRKFGREETPGVALLLAGICADCKNDKQRIERGGTMFEDLYRSFRETGR